MQAKREQWSGFSKTTQASRLVFQAESEVNINMARRYGRGQGGRRVVARAPLNIPKSTTILICTLCFVQCCMWCRVEYNGECYQVTTPNGRMCITRVVPRKMREKEAGAGSAGQGGGRRRADARQGRQRAPAIPGPLNVSHDFWVLLQSGTHRQRCVDWRENFLSKRLLGPVHISPNTRLFGQFCRLPR